MHALALLALINGLSDAVNSPFIVPVVGCIMVLGIVLGGIWSSNRQAELRSRERLECIARGITPPPTPEEIALTQGKPAGSLIRRRANIRLTGIILISSAIGIIIFFVALAAILSERDVLCGAAVGLIPAAIGAGFLFDTRIQTQEIEERTNA